MLSGSKPGKHLPSTGKVYKKKGPDQGLFTLCIDQSDQLFYPDNGKYKDQEYAHVDGPV